MAGKLASIGYALNNEVSADAHEHGFRRELLSMLTRHGFIPTQSPLVGMTDS